MRITEVQLRRLKEPKPVPSRTGLEPNNNTMTTVKDICTTYSKAKLDAFLSFPEFGSFHLIGKHYAQLLWDKVELFALDLRDGSEFLFNDECNDNDIEKLLEYCEDSDFIFATEDSYLKEIYYPMELDHYTLQNGKAIEVVYAKLVDNDGSRVGADTFVGSEDDFNKHILEGLEKQDADAEHDDSNFYCFVDTEGKTLSEMLRSNKGRARIVEGIRMCDADILGITEHVEVD